MHESFNFEEKLFKKAPYRPKDVLATNLQVIFYLIEIEFPILTGVVTSSIALAVSIAECKINLTSKNTFANTPSAYDDACARVYVSCYCQT